MALVRAQQEVAYSPVSRATLQDHVLERLRELIQNGGIEPGRTVTVQSLAEAFGVSAMPVREAMHRLVAEKALTVVAGRSVGIPPLTVDRLEDLRRVRVEVESTATKWAARSISSADMDHLEGLLHEMHLAGVDNDRSRYLPANRDFHFTIYRAAGSATLLSIIESLWLQIGPYINLLTKSENWEPSALAHVALHAALRARNPTAASRAVQSDIDGAAKALSRVLAAPAPHGSASARST